MLKWNTKEEWIFLEQVKLMERIEVETSQGMKNYYQGQIDMLEVVAYRLVQDTWGNREVQEPEEIIEELNFEQLGIENSISYEDKDGE